MCNLTTATQICRYAEQSATLLECMRYLATKAPEESELLPDLIEIAHERALELAYTLDELEVKNV